MTAAGFDSFDTSDFDAFTDTGFDARGPASLPRASVWAIDANGSLRWVYDTASNCNGISVGSDGMVWVAGAIGGGSTVWRINRGSGGLAAQYLVPYGSGQANAPIKAVQSGSFFYVTSNATLYKYTTSGFTLQFAEPTSYIADMKLVANELYCAEWETGPTKRSTQFGIVLQRAADRLNGNQPPLRTYAIDYLSGVLAGNILSSAISLPAASAHPDWPILHTANSWAAGAANIIGVKMLSQTEMVCSGYGIVRTSKLNPNIWVAEVAGGRLDENGGKIYATNTAVQSGLPSGNLVSCVDANSGAVLWTYNYPKGGGGVDIVADPNGNGCYVCGYRST